MSRPLTREHMIQEVRDLIILLNGVKENQNSFLWEYFTYFFIQVVFDKEKFIDWAEIIVDKLHEELSQMSVTIGFYMSSYMFYILASCRKWEGFPHRIWVDTMAIYYYYPLLKKKRNREDF